MVVVSFIAWQSCEYEVLNAPVDCGANPVLLELVSVQNSNCALNDGKVEVVASGGTGNFHYRIEGREPQAAPVLEGIGAGLYQVTAFDENNCSATLEVTVKNQNGLNITFETSEAGCNNSNGRLAVNAFDGTAPYQYKIDDGAFSSNNIFEGLFPREYTLMVKDADGCGISQKIKITSGISYAASIASIVESKCAIKGCHNGSQFPDFRIFKNIHDNAGQIKALTGDRTMPQEGSLNEAQINMIACWVDDGAPNN